MIHWNVDPEIFSIGPLSVRYYGLFFATAFIIGFRIMQYVFKEENRPEDDLNDLIWYMIFGTVIGARLGHILFYNPDFYLSNPLEILKVWHGGLASHGAAIGILIALYMYSKKKRDQGFIWVLDRIVITVALGGFFIRMGNLFNSEILGVETSVPWAFVFERVDMVPRHPSQLYEAIAYLAIFFILLFKYKQEKGNLREGLIFGIFLVLVFSARFFIEFTKTEQADFETGLFRMGQILSVPLIVAGFYFLIGYKPTETKTPANVKRRGRRQ